MNRGVVCLVVFLTLLSTEVGHIEVASGTEDAASTPSPTAIVPLVPQESNATSTATMQPPQTETQPQTSLMMIVTVVSVIAVYLAVIAVLATRKGK